MGSSALMADVVGYTVVRVLGRTRRATLLLAQHEGEPRVLRVFSTECGAAESDRELEARARAPHEHSAALLDLATSDTGAPIAVLEHLPGPRLAELVTARAGDLAPGEAVTLIVPILEAVREAHERGLTFGGVFAEGVRLRADGAPVIARFHEACAGPVLPAHFRDRDSDYGADRESALALGLRIARQVAGPSGDSLVSVLRNQSSVSGDAGLESTVLALFDCATPVPVRTDVPTPTPARGDGGVAGSDSRAVESVAVEPVSAQPSRLSSLLRRLAIPDTIVETLGELESRLVVLTTTVRARVTAGRGARSVIVGSAGVVSILLTLLLLAAGAERAETSVEPRGAAVPTESVPAGQGAGSPDSSARAAGGAPEVLRSPEPEEWMTVVSVLVERWSSCRNRADRTACAHDSVQPGSSAESALDEPGDTTATALRDWHRGEGEVIVVERMGAAVFVDLIARETTTASLLLMRSEAGWRLRDVLVASAGL